MNYMCKYSKTCTCAQFYGCYYARKRVTKKDAEECRCWRYESRETSK